jgi:hypothetical protein
MNSKWSRLAEIAGILAGGLDRTRPLTGEVTLTQADAGWLCELLTAIMAGEDVSRRFLENRKPSPEADRNFWIACDYAQHVHAGIKPAAEKVADRWSLSGPEAVETIYKRMRQHVDQVRELFGPGFARVIKWHRTRIEGGS